MCHTHGVPIGLHHIRNVIKITFACRNVYSVQFPEEIETKKEEGYVQKVMYPMSQQDYIITNEQNSEMANEIIKRK